MTFNNNSANTGGVISSQSIDKNSLKHGIYLKSLAKSNHMIPNQDNVYSDGMTSLIFGGNSTVLFTSNIAEQGGAISSDLPIDIKFNENSTISFIHNRADYGGALCCKNNVDVIVEGNTMVNFTSNKANRNGGAVHCTYTTDVIIQDNSAFVFNGNAAKYDGGAIYLSTFSEMTLTKESKSKMMFSNNRAANGGAIHIDSSSSISLGGKSTVIFMKNEAINGGTVHCHNNSEIKFKGYLHTTFENNMATLGGAIYSVSSCNISFEQHCNLTFVNNTAQQHGGAVFTRLSSYIYFKEKSIVMLNRNEAVDNGGSMYSESYSVIIFMDSSVAIFYDNVAHNGEGGAIYSNTHSKMVLKGNSQTTFISNHAIQGGTIYSSYYSSVIFDDGTVVIFNNSMAVSGGAIYAYDNCYIIFQGNYVSSVSFNNNTAEQYGGAMHLARYSGVILKGNMGVRFYINEALSGGAVYANDYSKVTFTENSTAILYNNNAKDGGAIYITTSDIVFTANCSIKFYYNTAWQDGGALYLDDQYLATFNNNTSVTFANNTASDYGGAIYSKILESKINFNTTNIIFLNNQARTTGNSVFLNVLLLCNSSCLKSNILGITNGKNYLLKQHITTSPSKLLLYSPAYCVSDNKNQLKGCGSYFVDNVMLGQEILIDVCMYDYYDQPSDTAQFLITSANNQESYIPASRYVLISCNNTIQGIKIIGNNSLPSNYTLEFTLYVNRRSEMRTISANLTVELVPCHPGYWYYSKPLQCECYNASDIVFCSHGSSTIKRGYWFGSVSGKPTVALCPINYCNFTCCETSNGYYHLSPVRDNQCKFHRSGVACGSCEETYTLSFDSAECVHVKNCSTGQTALVITLIIFYWIAIITSVFLMMHFKVDIGYLYAITYYYSVVDLMLSQNWYLSNELYTAINIMSSITKITPQFLGRFCLVEGMSGIDQQFIHYVHPTAIALFLIIITLLARRSRRLSSFISKGIIHVICCLLLLSYTSVATTSLLLMRPLIFFEVDKVYTYVSPDIEYFHGRHLAYAIVAVLFIIVIVIGLPLLLALEPFLNSKINFVRMKPLLDQFQGSYKDKYRFFAAYYMVCRLVIIAIIIANSSNSFIAQYVLITTCVVISLIHQILKPYSSNFLNIFDEAILHLMVLVSVLPLVELFDSFDLNKIVGIAFVLVILPSVSLIIAKLTINRKKIKRKIDYYYFKCTHLHLYLRRYNEIPLNNNEIPLNDIATTSNTNEIGNDDGRRINAAAPVEV